MFSWTKWPWTPLKMSRNGISRCSKRFVFQKEKKEYERTGSFHCEKRCKKGKKRNVNRKLIDQRSINGRPIKGRIWLLAFRFCFFFGRPLPTRSRHPKVNTSIKINTKPFPSSKKKKKQTNKRRPTITEFFFTEFWPRSKSITGGGFTEFYRGFTGHTHHSTGSLCSNIKKKLGKKKLGNVDLCDWLSRGLIIRSYRRPPRVRLFVCFLFFFQAEPTESLPSFYRVFIFNLIFLKKRPSHPPASGSASVSIVVIGQWLFLGKKSRKTR